MLSREYPNATTELKYRNPFELLVATVLSAQSTDVKVNLVTPNLDTRYCKAICNRKRNTINRPIEKKST